MWCGDFHASYIIMVKEIFQFICFNLIFVRNCMNTINSMNRYSMKYIKVGKRERKNEKRRSVICFS